MNSTLVSSYFRIRENKIDGKMMSIINNNNNKNNKYCIKIYILRGRLYDPHPHVTKNNHLPKIKNKKKRKYS